MPAISSSFSGKNNKGALLVSFPFLIIVPTLKIIWNLIADGLREKIPFLILAILCFSLIFLHCLLFIHSPFCDEVKVLDFLFSRMCILGRSIPLGVHLVKQQIITFWRKYKFFRCKECGKYYSEYESCVYWIKTSYKFEKVYFCSDTCHCRGN